MILQQNLSAMTIEQSQYPIGKWQPKKSYSTKEIERNIGIIEKYPSKYNLTLVQALSLAYQISF